MFSYILIVLFIFFLGYIFYGNFLNKEFQLKDDEEMPSKKLCDGIDYCPSNKFVLLGHHFSSIAGAGPIVGPIIAGLSFGWGPAILWIVLGSIFVGGLHDFASLVISVRHNGLSVAQIAHKYINKSTYKIFLIFIWLALMYVVAVFADLAAETFAKKPSVAQISLWYVVVAILFGVMFYRLKIRLSISTVISLFLIVLGIVFSLEKQFLVLSKNVWIWFLIIYCLIVSILPVWLLLQPRDYLSSYFLYFTVVVGLLGLFFSSNKLSYPIFIGFNSKSIGPLVPFMFITIACGAISGFHSLVSSGTTSKQLDKAKNAKFVGYGGMLLEGIVAAISLGCLMILPRNTSLTDPQHIYASGIGNFCSFLGIHYEVGEKLGFLAISAFILTTLDTATRISRYIFQELIEKNFVNFIGRVIATLVSLLLPLLLLNLKLRDLNKNIVACWKIIWPLFGTTNQLLAALVLLIIYIWIKKQGYKTTFYILIPMIFMLLMTLIALFYTIIVRINQNLFDLITFIAIILFLLAIYIINMSIKVTKNV
ncbi:MAG: carbon starvation protein A [Endomicrobia bacterium]|nr:carbon starvation protein A [Endomicrobiia bacterium]